MRVQGNITADIRARQIRDRLAANGTVRIDDLSESLGVSEMTIRRDLQDLESSGVAHRVRGGAVLLRLSPIPFAERTQLQAKAKLRIATKLLDLVPAGAAIGLDASSTVHRLATSLTDASNLTVVTNSMEAFVALQGKPGISPILTGGSLEPETGSLVGPMAIRSATSVLIRRLFVSAAAVSSELGTSESSLAEADVKRALATVSDEVVVAVDSSKLESRAVARAFEWPEVSVLVTDLDPAHPKLAPFRSLVKVI